MTRAVAQEFGERVRLVIHTGPQTPESARAYGVLTSAALILGGRVRLDRITPATVRETIERELARGTGA